MRDTLSIKTDDGSFDAYVYSSQKHAPAIVLVQEIFGVNAELEDVAKSWARDGYTVVCPDLFWRVQPGLQLSSHSESDVRRALGIYSSLDVSRSVLDVMATVDAARDVSGNGKVGVMGFCLGGLLTFLTTARSTVDASVEYYGGGTQNYLEEMSEVNSPLLIHLAGDDEYIDGEAQMAIHNAAAHNKFVEIHAYPGRNHAFARPGGDHFHRDDAKAARASSLAFFDIHLAVP